MTNMAKKEMLETICIFFCERLQKRKEKVNEGDTSARTVEMYFGIRTCAGLTVVIVMK